MNRLSMIGALSLVLLVGLCLSCGGSGETPSAESVGAEVDSAVDTAVEAADEAADEAVADADATIDKIKAELADKEAELEKVADELKGLSPQDMMGDTGEELKAKSEALNDEIQQLNEKLKSLME
jgi:peptidoglycan hydrolase CwlO-like protein